MIGIREYAIIGLLLALLVASGLAKYYHGQVSVVQGRFDVFVAQVAAEGEKAKAAELEKEKARETAIKSAVASRNVALAKLRESASSPRDPVPAAPAAAPGTDQICFGSAGYTAAFAKFRDVLVASLETARGIALSGDSCQIDARALIEGWPR